MAPRIISVANQKGGVGKTTTAVNLAFGLARNGRKTLIVDCDPQANTTSTVLGIQTEPEATIYDLLIRDGTLTETVTDTTQENLTLLPSEIDLAGVEAELIGQVGSQTILRSKFRSRIKTYDYVILDTPPSLGLLTLNALAASTEILIPVSASFFALKGLAQLEKTIELVRERLDVPKLKITGVLCTLYDHTNVARDVYAALKQRFEQQTFKTVIPKNVKVEEAHSRGRSVFDYAPDSNGAQAYAQFVKEVEAHG